MARSGERGLSSDAFPASYTAGDGIPTAAGPEGARPGREQRAMMAALETLEIARQGAELTINETGGSDILWTRTVYIDGRRNGSRAAANVEYERRPNGEYLKHHC